MRWVIVSMSKWRRPSFAPFIHGWRSHGRSRLNTASGMKYVQKHRTDERDCSIRNHEGYFALK